MLFRSVGTAVKFLALLISFLLTVPVAATQDYTVVSDWGSSASLIGKGRVGGFSDSADVIFENPAALSPIGTMSLSFMDVRILDGTYLRIMIVAQYGS